LSVLFCPLSFRLLRYDTVTLFKLLPQFSVIKSLLPTVNLYSLFRLPREFPETNLSDHQLGYVDFRRLEAVLGYEQSIAFGDVSELRIKNLFESIQLISVKDKRNALEIIGLLEIMEEKIVLHIKKQIRKQIRKARGEILDGYSDDTSVISNFSLSQRSLPFMNSPRIDSSDF
jgi:hypothetical protein